RPGVALRGKRIAPTAWLDPVLGARLLEGGGALDGRSVGLGRVHGRSGPRAASNAEQRDSGARWKKESGGRSADGWARALSESVTQCYERAVGEAPDVWDQAVSERGEERRAGWERAHAARL